MPDASHVGRRYRAEGQVVEPERARAFAAAIAGADTVAEPDAVPPTFAAVYLLYPTLGQLFGDAEVGIDLAGLIHGEQEFTFHSPARPGDVIDATAEITAVEQKRNLIFVTVDLDSTRQGGERVCSGRAMLLIRGGAS